MVLHFKPRALSGQAFQLPALLIAAEAGAFPFWRSVWKDSTVFLADHLQADCASVIPIRRVMPTPCRFPAVTSARRHCLANCLASPDPPGQCHLCLLKPWAHPFSSGAHWAPLCVHTPLSAGTVHCLWPAEGLCPHPASVRLCLEALFLWCEAPGLNPPQVFRLCIVSSQCLHFIKGKPSCL